MTRPTWPYLAWLEPGQPVTHAFRPGRHGWLQVLRRQVEADGVTLSEGDGAAISEEAGLSRSRVDLSALVDFKADLRAEIAVLQRDRDELKKTKEEWSRRLWAMAGPLLGALVGVVVGSFLRKA